MASPAIGSFSPAHSPRLLIGPYHCAEHWKYMEGAFDDFEHVTFGTGPGVDVEIRATEDIRDILGRLPGGFQPDLLILWRPEYGSVPRGLEQLPFPVVMLTSDWYLEFTRCLENAHWVNLVVTGSRGERAFRAAGIDHVLALPMLGYEPSVDGAGGELPRDIDVFHAGSTNWAVHAEREHVLAELLALPEGIDVRIRSHLSRQDYAEHLARSRIVVNPSVIGEVNMRVYETCAAGACLFVEADNLDVPSMLEPGREVVLYERSNLREKLLHYLEHEDERAAVARRGQQRLLTKTYRAQMKSIVQRLVEMGSTRLLSMGRTIEAVTDREKTHRYAATNLRYTFGDTLGLAGWAARRLRRDGDPKERGLLALMAYVAEVESVRAEDKKVKASGTALLHGIVRELASAAQQSQGDPSLCFNLAAVCVQHGRPETALLAVARAVEALRSETPPHWDEGTFLAYSSQDATRLRHERALWEALESGQSAGLAARSHMLERLYNWQAELLRRVGDLAGAEQALRHAISAEPSTFASRAVLADVLAAAGRDEEAADVLREHLQGRPLDLHAWCDLAQLEIRRGLVEQAARTLRHLDRITRVFGDAEGQRTVQAFLRKVEAIPSAAAAAPAS